MQHDRISFSSAIPGLSPHRFSIREATSSLFSISLWARSPDPSLDLSAIVGHPATFRLVSGHAHTLNLGARAFNGIISRAEQVHALQPAPGQKGLSTYHLRLVPDVWLLTQRLNSRIYQHLSIPDIADRLLTEWSLKPIWDIDRTHYPKLEYKVQYAESDYNFLARLLEEAGIAFSFLDHKGRSVLTLSDRLQANEPRPGPPIRYVDNPNQAAELEYVTRVRLGREVRPGAVTVRDYDPRRPGFDLFAEAPKAATSEDRYEQYHFDQGAFLVETGNPDGTPTADGHGFARHDHRYGKDLAARMLDGERAGVRGVFFEANTFDLAPGSVFTINNHPHPEMPPSRKLLVLETSFEGAVDGEWTLSAHAVFADAPYHPPRRTAKPIVHGLQSATVVGPKGQEIHTDEYGRVRVELRWDREAKLTEQSSCWVRVSQGWGGMGYGMSTLPRIGQEVLVTFLEGDPDQPMITGRAYNAVQRVPHPLPEHKTRSAWKSSSSLGSNGFNEIMFDDLAGKELVWQQAQKDRRRWVKNDEWTTVMHNRATLVKNDEAEHTDGFRTRWVGKDADEVNKQHRRERIEGDSHLSVHGNVRELVQGDQSLTIVDDQAESVKGRFALRAGRKVHCIAGEAFIGEAADDVTLAGPGGFIRIDSSGVTISGTLVKINVTGTPGKGLGCNPALPEEPAGPTIINLRWSHPKVRVGESVEAIFEVNGFDGGEATALTVYECDASGKMTSIDTVSTKIKNPDGEMRVLWSRPEGAAESDLREDEEDGDEGPLEYCFAVRAGVASSRERSNPLWLTNTVEVSLIDANGSSLSGQETRVTLTAADGTVMRATTRDGTAKFDDVVIGTLKVAAERAAT